MCWYRTIREWQGGGGREKQLQLQLALLGLHALYPNIGTPAIRSADALLAFQMAHRERDGGVSVQALQHGGKAGCLENWLQSPLDWDE